jgi:hypothetical protein
LLLAAPFLVFMEPDMPISEQPGQESPFLEWGAALATLMEFMEPHSSPPVCSSSFLMHCTLDLLTNVYGQVAAHPVVTAGEMAPAVSPSIPTCTTIMVDVKKERVWSFAAPTSVHRDHKQPQALSPHPTTEKEEAGAVESDEGPSSSSEDAPSMVLVQGPGENQIKVRRLQHPFLFA